MQFALIDEQYLPLVFPQSNPKHFARHACRWFFYTLSKGFPFFKYLFYTHERWPCLSCFIKNQISVIPLQYTVTGKHMCADILSRGDNNYDISLHIPHLVTAGRLGIKFPQLIMPLYVIIAVSVWFWRSSRENGSCQKCFGGTAFRLLRLCEGMGGWHCEQELFEEWFTVALGSGSLR